MVVADKVVAVAGSQLPDIEHLSGASIRFEEQLVFFHILGPRKERVALSALQRGLRDEGIEKMSRSVLIATPRERALSPSRVTPGAVVYR